MEEVATQMVELLNALEDKLEDKVVLQVNKVDDEGELLEENVQVFQELKQINFELEKRIRQQTVELQKAKERLELVGLATQDAVWDWDLKTDQFYWNQRFFTDFGYAKEEVYSGPESKYANIHPKDQERVVQGIHQIIDHGKQNWSDYYRFRKGDGSYAFIYDRGYCLYDEAGNPYRMVGAMMDITRQKEVEEALEQSKAREKASRQEAEQQRARLERLFKEAPALVNIQRGPDHVFELVHPMKYQLLGHRQLLGKSSREALPELGDSFHSLLDRIYKKGKPFNGKEELIRLDRNNDGRLEDAYFDITYQPIFDAAGEVEGVMTFAVEVTEQVEARKQVEIVLNSLPLIATTTLPDGTTAFVNKTYLEYSGASQDELSFEQQLKFIHPEDVAPLVKAREEALAFGHRFELEIRIKRQQDGQCRWHLCRTVPLVNPAGENALWISTATDIHEQKLMEAALQEREMRLSAMFNQSSVGIGVLDLNQRFTFVNDRFVQIAGRPKEALIGLSVLEITHPEDRGKNRELLKKMFDFEQELSLEKRYLHPDGKSVWISVSATVIKDEQGMPTGIMGVCQDISERKLAQEQLKQLTKKLAIANEEIQANNRSLEASNKHLSQVNEDLDNFVYTASHDLKAPILNIDGLMKLLTAKLKQKGWQDSSIQGITEMIKTSVNRFQETIKDLTEVAKVQKHFNSENERINLGSIFRDIQLDLREQIRESGAIVETHLDNCQEILFPKKNLKSVVYNLLSNAIKYRDPERTPHIVVSCKEDADYWILSVKDNGLGMNLSDMSKVFGMFNRLHKHVDGTGIGLYIVKKIVENAGGKIEVESNVGEGSTFFVYFKKVKE